LLTLLPVASSTSALPTVASAWAASLLLVLGSGVCRSIGTGTSITFARLLVGKTLVEVVVEAVEFGHLLVNAIVVCAPFHGYGVCRTIDTGARTPFDSLLFGGAIAEALVVGHLIVGAIVVGTLVVRVVVTCVVLTEDGRGHRGSRRAVPGTSLPGLGSGSAGLAEDGHAPVVRDLVDLHFHNFLPLFCLCGTRHRSCVSAASLPKGRLDFADHGSHDVFYLIWLVPRRLLGKA
jgi:hypothetical protein